MEGLFYSTPKNYISPEFCYLRSIFRYSSYITSTRINLYKYWCYGKKFIKHFVPYLTISPICFTCRDLLYEGGSISPSLFEFSVYSQKMQHCSCHRYRNLQQKTSWFEEKMEFRVSIKHSRSKIHELDY